MKFPTFMRSTLLQLDEGEIITITGQLDSYENWLELVVVNNGEILEQDVAYVDEGEDVCQELQDFCMQGEYAACEMYSQMTASGDC